MERSARSGRRSRTEDVLGCLRRLSWKVTRLHRSPRGSLIVTALRHGRVTSVELPEPCEREPALAWLARLDAALCRNAYDPADSPPPLMVLALSEELAELVSSRELREESSRP